jgi:hypothetical protein
MPRLDVGTAYVFRVYSDQSHGTNTVRKFEPAAYSEGRPRHQAEQQPEALSSISEQLPKALAWKDVPQCPFVFFTRSLLFALVYASYKKTKGEANIIIVCVKVSTATSADGAPAKFYSVSELMKRFNVQSRERKDGSLYEYRHELAITTSLIPGEGSTYARYESLVAQNLHELHPVLGTINDRHRPRLNIATEDLREFGFTEAFDLSNRKISVAMQLALNFVPHATGRDNTDSDENSTHLLAWFLSLQKRSIADPALKMWIDQHTDIFPAPTYQPDTTSRTPSSVVEIQQYLDIVDLLQSVSFTRTRLNPPSTSELAVSESEWEKWDSLRRRKLAEHRGKRSNDDTYRVTKTRRDRPHHDRGNRPKSNARSRPRTSTTHGKPSNTSTTRMSKIRASGKRLS